MSELPRMQRVNRRNPCPICGKPDWCGISEDERIVVCMRVCEGSVKQTRNGGYLHVRYEDPDWRSGPRVRTVRIPVRTGPPADFESTVVAYAAAVDRGRLLELAGRLGVTRSSLRRLGIGWSSEHRAWSFPMRDAERQVRGIRLRSWTGRKWAVKGSRDGLFLPTNLDFSETLFICEGPTDTAAMLSLGFEAVGRPSCRGGTKDLVALIRGAQSPEVVIVADRGDPGQQGAADLAKALVLVCRSVRVIDPPEGIGDARAWKQAGVTPEEVRNAIEAARVHRVAVRRTEA